MALRFRTWPVAAVGHAGLLLLGFFSMSTASRRAQEIYTQLDELNTRHRQVEAKLRQLRADVHLSGIFVRDYLLDTARERDPEYRQQLADFRDTNRNNVRELLALARERGEDDSRILRLEANLHDYWEGFEPLFDWTIVEKINNSAGFLRREVVPRRQAVMSLAEEIEGLNNANLTAQREAVTRQHAGFRTELDTLLWRSVFFGLLLAIPVAIRLRILEGRSDRQTVRAQEAEAQMRTLSQQLVATQEDERRKLSRELHDHVGQMLTALRMELGRIDRVRPPDPRLAAAVAESRKLVDDMVHLVRDLALGLRPSMLDDLGLRPALEWQARDFTRRSSVPVQLAFEGDLDGLSDQHRTCVYRVVQESLTNCVRHAKATHISVSVAARGAALQVIVADDGIGMAPSPRTGGFGLRGIEERVRELGGTVDMTSAEGQGAALTIVLPLALEAPAHARAAG
jgi:signal transduction histidine kinase